MLQQKPFHAKSNTTSNCTRFTQKMYETKHTTILWNAGIFFNKTTHMDHNINISTVGNTHLKSGLSLQTAPRGCKQYSTVWKGTPAEWASWECQFNNTVWLPAHSTLDSTLTFFSTRMIKHLLCQCSTMTSSTKLYTQIFPMGMCCIVLHSSFTCQNDTAIFTLQ